MRQPQATDERELLFLGYALAAALLTPVGIVLHEAGHWLAAASFGYPPEVFAYNFVSGLPRSAAAWQHALASLAGPVVTVGIVVACYAAVVRYGARVILIAAVFAAGLRQTLYGGTFLVSAFAPEYRPLLNGDEVEAAAQWGLPSYVLLVLTTSAVCGVWAATAVKIPHGKRLPVVTSCLFGSGLGFLLYFRVIGPWLLPW